MHVPWDKFAAHSDGGGVEGADDETYQCRTYGCGGEGWNEPSDAFQHNGDGYIDEDGIAFADEYVERRQDDSADSKP